MEEFTVRADGAAAEYRPHCRSCVAARWKETRDLQLARKAARNYGVAKQQYFDMMARGCSICGASSTPEGRRLHLDHCHKTGKFRGVLCHACNTALGLLGEDLSRMAAMMAYIREHRKVVACLDA